jgi:hypothetical protein
MRWQIVSLFFFGKKKRTPFGARWRAAPENVRKPLDRWYRAQAEIIFHERLATCHQKMPKGIPLPPLRIDPPDENPLG